MLSKRGKAKTSAAKAKNKKSGGARPKKSNAKPGRLRKSRSAGGPKGMGRATSQLYSAPTTLGQVGRNNMFGMKFSSAAAHDEFPEGGLRVSGILPGSTDTATLTQDTTYTGLFSTTGVQGCAVSPCGNVTTYLASMFASTSPLAVFAQYFRKYRFRFLSMETESMIPTGGSLGANGGATVLGSPIIQISYERDAYTADVQQVGYTIDTAVQTRNCTRYNAWMNQIVCPLISGGGSDRADELYYCDSVSDLVSDATPANIRQTFQGAVLAVGNVVNTLADLKLAKVLWHFSVDLYGFTNLAAAVEPRVLKKRPTLKGEKERRELLKCGVLDGDAKYDVDRGDRKLPARAIEPDDADLVEVTPKNSLRIRPEILVDSSLLKTAPPSVAGSRVSSKK